jgi:MFS family permease
MQGFGSLVAVPFTQRFGTYVVPLAGPALRDTNTGCNSFPVMFWSTLMALLMTVTCALCPDNWIGFIAIRIVQGFFATAAQVIGMTVIQDM